MKVRISRKWRIEKDLRWILDNAEFAFTTNNDVRPRIYTKVKYDNRYNCFKIDNDQYGIDLNSMSEYSESFFEGGTKEMVMDNFPQFIERQMKIWGAEEFINPKPRLFEFLRSKKDIIIEI